MNILLLIKNIYNLGRTLFTNPFAYKTIPHENSNILRILGNGASLNNSNINYEDDNFDYLVVNRHVIADNYKIIKPKYYVLTDPHFFIHSEGLGVLKKILTNTSWKMYLFVPFSRDNNKLKSLVSRHPNIVSIFYNKTRIDQTFFLSQLCYKYQLGMPVPQNVVVAAIMLGIVMRYKKIELYGVEHSWLSALYVGDDNLVYLRNSHFYDKNPVPPKPQKDIQNLDEYPLYKNLQDYARMFQSYWEIKLFLENSGINTKVINMTPNSYIDAFERG